jgi:O-antigen ligase
LSGLEAFAQRPWTGHGIDAPLSVLWRANNLAYVNPEDTGVGTHNGYVDYLIMGGIPLCAVFVVLHLWLGWRLWRARRVRDVQARELCALALCLYMYFLADVVLGDSFSKLGWWSFGVGLQVLSEYARRGEGSVRA